MLERGGNFMAKEQETKRAKFVRLAEARTNKIINMLQLLGNCSNSSAYDYTQKDVDKIFAAIEAEVKKKRKIRLVGDYEADVGKNLISVESPLGKALLGKKISDIVDFETPSNVFSYEILNITNS